MSDGTSFNPRARAGRDLIEAADKVARYLFQSTRPRGARQMYNMIRDYKREFQSTRPRGARQLYWIIVAEADRFQSTRPRGARHPNSLGCQEEK